MRLVDTGKALIYGELMSKSQLLSGSFKLNHHHRTDSRTATRVGFWDRVGSTV